MQSHAADFRDICPYRKHGGIVLPRRQHLPEQIQEESESKSRHKIGKPAAQVFLEAAQQIAEDPGGHGAEDCGIEKKIDCCAHNIMPF